MRIFDRSLRHKIPLWGGALIVASAVAVSGAQMVRAYADLKRDTINSSEGLGHTLAKTLFPALLHDDAWRAFELIRAPFHEGRPEQPLEARAIFVVDADLRVLVSSAPRAMPLLAPLDTLGADYPQLATGLRLGNRDATATYEFADSGFLHVTIPVAEDGARVGTLVITHSKDAFLPRFFSIALGGAGMGALVLAILLPINWYWGRRMAEPLVELAKGMGDLGKGQPAELPASLYAYRDELGQLYEAYRDAARGLREKAALEQEMLQSERLAAVGRLAAGIAHEVNNPLGGMLMALDNLKQRGRMDPAVAKTAALLERGLQQVAETVGALLVEARVVSRPLTRHDLDDVHTLLEPQAVKKQVGFDWQIRVPEQVGIPAGFVRQILINLLLNAVHATESGGRIRVEAGTGEGRLLLCVANTGAPLPEAVREHLFEPFVSGREGGHGLGLWVTYQTVTQLGGQIAADWRDGEVRFTVSLPLEGDAA
ncbi:MAG: HAMP domain-containing histidine kinase [Rhodocyclaceae bacterium]|nr:HAMP domain-containing histidine kinase [Rhodocyclaceae bacterium]